jgi:hypothetical protein
MTLDGRCKPGTAPGVSYSPVLGDLLIRGSIPGDSRFCYDGKMRDIVILFVHVIATFARLLGPGGLRSVVAESILVKQQFLILNRSRQRSPNLRTSGRLVAGLCALLTRPARLIRSAIVLKSDSVNATNCSRQCDSPRLGCTVTRRIGQYINSP